LLAVEDTLRASSSAIPWSLVTLRARFIRSPFGVLTRKRREGLALIRGSVADPWNFGTDPDPADPYLWLMDPDADLRQWPSRCEPKSFFAYYFSRVYLDHFSE
jgi:hypothetical protein